VHTKHQFYYLNYKVGSKFCKWELTNDILTVVFDKVVSSATDGQLPLHHLLLMVKQIFENVALTFQKSSDEYFGNCYSGKLSFTQNYFWKDSLQFSDQETV